MRKCYTEAILKYTDQLTKSGLVILTGFTPAPDDVLRPRQVAPHNVGHDFHDNRRFVHGHLQLTNKVMNSSLFDFWSFETVNVTDSLTLGSLSGTPIQWRQNFRGNCPQ